MKKLLLTVAISGLMTTGASAVNYNVAGCLAPTIIAAAQKNAGDKNQFKIEDSGNSWWISLTKDKTEPKNLKSAMATTTTKNKIEITCDYDNGILAQLMSN